MDEEKTAPSQNPAAGPPSPPAQEAPPKEGPSPEHHQQRRQRSVFQYIAILFAAAFVLLLLTYLMDRRQYELIQDQNQAQIDDLLQSATAVQSLQNLSNENAQLKEAVEDLEEELAQAEARLDELIADVQALETGREQLSAAMDWFWQIDEAYVRGRYSLCRQLIQSLEEAGLAEALPRESVTDNGRFSPYDRYQEIYNVLY